MRWITPPHRAQRHPHRRASGNAVIDDDRAVPTDCYWRAACTIARAPPLNLLELTRRLFLHIAFRYAQGVGQILIDEDLGGCPIGNGTQSQLELPGHPDFAYQHDVERRAERSGNLKTDGDTAARQCQDDRRPVFELRQFGGQLAAGSRAIGEFHALASINGMRSSHPGRFWVRRGLGPPAQGAVAVHTTPIAVPISVTIGQPDISLRMPSAAWVIHSGPPKWRTVQENHRRPSSDSSRPGTQKLTGFRRAPAIENAFAVSISALYSSACGLSGEPSTAMSAIGSTKRHTAHARGSSPRRAMSGPKMRSLGSKKDWAGGRNGRQCAAVITSRSPAPSTTKPRPLPAVMTPAVSISIIMVFCS